MARKQSQQSPRLTKLLAGRARILYWLITSATVVFLLAIGGLIFRAAVNYQTLILISFAALILFVLAGSVVLYRAVFFPMFKLTQSAVAGTNGNPDSLFGLDRDDEIGDLARTIRLMRNNLNSANVELAKSENIIARTYEELIYREDLLQTVNQAAETLFAANEADTMTALMKGMEIVGHCLDIDRVQIWRNKELNGELHFAIHYEWLSEIGKQKPKTPMGTHYPYSGRSGWLEKFSRDENINTPVSRLPPADAVFLGQYEMVSVVMLPLFLEKEFIGFMSVSDCRRERVFTSDEIGMIDSAGLMFTAVFNRSLQADKIAETNSKLQSALEYALSAGRTKSDFLSVMSHEMRTPMNAILGMTTIAKKEEDNERKGNALAKVEEAAYHLLSIINDVLDMSKIEANKLELRHVEFDFRKLLQRAVSLASFRMDEKRHNLSIKVDESVPHFYSGDEQRLTQILINLLSNAAIYTQEEGEINLDVSLVSHENAVCELRVAVSDNGIGIAPENQQRVFEIFEREDNSATRVYSGTGLGLSITKRLVELMDGNISLESELGKGSCFTFTVKLGHLEKLREDYPVSEGTTTTSSLESIKFTGKRVLLAEDIEINREILIAQLDGKGLEIDIAQNGREAVEMIQANPGAYDLTFMDIQMPEMDGLEATRRIRSLPENSARDMPIIAVTANVFAEDVEKCFEAGMNEHIGKPLDMRILLEKLCKYLQRY